MRGVIYYSCVTRCTDDVDITKIKLLHKKIITLILVC